MPSDSCPQRIDRPRVSKRTPIPSVRPGALQGDRNSCQEVYDHLEEPRLKGSKRREWRWSDSDLNPYSGCRDCPYCWTRPTRQQTANERRFTRFPRTFGGVCRTWSKESWSSRFGNALVSADGHADFGAGISVRPDSRYRVCDGGNPLANTLHAGTELLRGRGEARSSWA